MAAGQRARAATYAGVFVVTLTTLMYEIALTRIFSVAMWYHFAFVAISVALFGMTVGALIVHLRPGWFAGAQVKPQMWRWSLAFGVSVALAFFTQLAIPFEPHLTMAGLWSVVLTCVVISVPFVCSGVVVALALTRFPDRVNRLYAADLIGAGLGCVLLVAAFDVLDGPSLVVAIAALACAGALLLAFDAGLRRGQVVSVLCVVCLGLLAGGNAYRHDRGDPFIRIVWAKEQKDPLHRVDRWNAFSRVTVDGDEGVLVPAGGYGASHRLPAGTMVEDLSVVIDGAASTSITGYTGDEAETDFLRYDITNLGYYAHEGDCRTVTIGVGGGRDVLSSLEFGCQHVTGIEINNSIIDLLTDQFGEFSGHLDQDPRVDLVNDEARSWLTRSDEEFDQIQISMIDTWAASAAGAFALTENSLYTTDGWHTFLDRLAPGGTLSVSRWYQMPSFSEPFEAFRVASLASEVLHQRGVTDPRDHVLIYEGPVNGFDTSAATFLVSPDPFTDETLATIAETAEYMGFRPVLTPTEAADPRFADIVAPGGPSAGIAQFDQDLSPPTDDRPFFFQMAELGTFLRGEGLADNLIFRPVLVLTMLAGVVLLLAAVCIGGPLVAMGRGTRHRGRIPFYGYFAGIGLGFMLIEFSQLQRLSTFLGHPTYALTVVLFTVLLFSGIGSVVAERITDPDRPRSLLVPVGALVVALFCFGLATEPVMASFAGSTTPVRIAASVGLLAPLALLMGMPFSIGMRAAGTDGEAPTAFLWGINGAMSVVASVLGALMAMFFGITVTFAAGAATYAAAAACLALIVRALLARSRPGTDEAPGTERGAAGRLADGGARPDPVGDEVGGDGSLVGAGGDGGAGDDAGGDGDGERVVITAGRVTAVAVSDGEAGVGVEIGGGVAVEVGDGDGDRNGDGDAVEVGDADGPGGPPLTPASG